MEGQFEPQPQEQYIPALQSQVPQQFEPQVQQQFEPQILSLKFLSNLLNHKYNQ